MLIANIDGDISGSFKSLARYEHLRHTRVYSRDNLLGCEQRLRFASSLTGSWFRWEAAVDSNLVWQQPVTSTLPLPNLMPQYAWNEEWRFLESDEINGKSRIDRLLLQLHNEQWQIILGRQTIPVGVGQIFSVISQTQRYPYLTLDSEYEKTEDAVTLSWLGVLRLEVRWLPKTPSQKNQNFHLRAKGSKSGLDVALTTGRSDDKEMIGLEVAGDSGDSVWRGEIAAYNAGDRGYFQALLGWERALSPKWRVNLEAFFNGFGDEEPYGLVAFRHRSAPYRGRLYAGTVVTWDPTSLLKVRLLTLINAGDGSVLLHPYLQYSLKTNLDLIGGQYVGMGSDDAEFGGQTAIAPGVSMGLSDLTYIGIRYYF